MQGGGGPQAAPSLETDRSAGAGLPRATGATRQVDGRRVRQRLWLDLAAERELGVVALALDIHHDDLAGLELPVQDLLGEHVLDLPLDGAAQRPGAQRRVVS